MSEFDPKSSRRRHGLSDDDVYLPYEIADLAECASGEIPNSVYGEVMELAEMLHDLEIQDAKELGSLLGAYRVDETPGDKLAPQGRKTSWSWNFDLDSISDEDYADLVYEGRKLCEAEPFKGQKDPGYCGSCGRDVHDAQVLDPKSWVHSSTERWFERAFGHFHGKRFWDHHREKKNNPPKISDRRLAINATRRKNE